MGRERDGNRERNRGVEGEAEPDDVALNPRTLDHDLSRLLTNWAAQASLRYLFLFEPYFYCTIENLDLNGK